MVKLFLSFCLLSVAVFSYAQEAPQLIAEGQALEQKFKEPEALAKYQQALAAQPSNVVAATKCALLCCSIGSREAEKEDKAKWFNKAKDYAAAAILYGPKDVEANYAMSVAFGKLTETETSNNKVVEYVKATKQYADKTLAINPDYGKAWNVLGQWHFEMLNLNMVKKAAVKIIYGGVGNSDIDTCIADLEKCKQLEPYCCLNYMSLAKAYRYNKEYEKALAALQQCIKSPSLQLNDRIVKEEAKKLLVDWQ
jgi:tetratricopeptide (TPR) repeat protein